MKPRNLRFGVTFRATVAAWPKTSSRHVCCSASFVSRNKLRKMVLPLPGIASSFKHPGCLCSLRRRVTLAINGPPHRKKKKKKKRYSGKEGPVEHNSWHPLFGTHGVAIFDAGTCLGNHNLPISLVWLFKERLPLCV